MGGMMDPRQVKTAEQARAIIEERGLTHVKVGVFDNDCVLRGKYMSKDKFLSSIEDGFGFCDVVLGWDSNDELYDNTTFTGWHTAYPDAPVRILLDTCRSLPMEGDMLFFLCEFSERAECVGPRAMLRRVLKKCSDMGFTAFGAMEFEFFLFDETPHSVREKNYRDLTPITPGNFGYSVLRSSVWSEFYAELLDTCEKMDMPIEGLHTETGPGVLEVAIGVDGVLAAADKAALFKTFAKVVAQRNDLMATFMAKWSADHAGQSGHIHLSLQKDGETAFHDPAGPHRMSQTMQHFLAGCQTYLPETLAMVASTVNSYSRLVPGAWAPTSATWGVENRTTALRVIPGSPKSQRIEYRIAAADANPYLAIAAALAAGLAGIEQELTPWPEVTGNAYTQSFDPALSLPSTLTEAAMRLKNSEMARSVFGADFIDHFAATREWEERQFRKAITDWELRRYFEII
ncbi:MAG: glutamine synthetase [Myxococcota bacterium]|jgi:glutamine synthetase